MRNSDICWTLKYHVTNNFGGKHVTFVKKQQHTVNYKTTLSFCFYTDEHREKNRTRHIDYMNMTFMKTVRNMEAVRKF